MSKRVFISHAVANRDLADRLVDLLETGVGIPDSEMFCSSLQGMGIPSGTDFVDFIRNQIREPRVVVLLLSQDYFHNQFCLCELGAAWVLSHRIIPLLVPPLEYKDVKAVLTGVQVLKIADSDHLNQMQADLVEALGIKGKAFARWEANRGKFLEWLEEQDTQGSTTTMISPGQFEELKEKYGGAVNAIGELEAELKKRQILIEQLKKTKDAGQVREIIAESLGAVEQFEQLVRRAKESLRSLPTVVSEAIYYHCRGEHLPWANRFDDYREEQIKAGIENDYLRERDEALELIEEDPKVSEAISVLNELASFIRDAEENLAFQEFYAENYDHRPNFTSRRFWETHLS